MVEHVTLMENVSVKQDTPGDTARVLFVMESTAKIMAHVPMAFVSVPLVLLGNAAM